tara:strand:+ start:28 stop:237 length:210 start_codon:yes stop_codon:yes gene_type:complete
VAKKRDFLMELDCIEGALAEARRLYLKGTNPQQILNEMKVDKKADSWIITVAHMAGWWYRYRDQDKGNT